MTNQRLATVAPSTMAVIPVPSPTTTPQSSRSCQNAVMAVARSRPVEIITTAVVMTRRRPKRLNRAAENGAMRPNSMMRKASAEEIVAVDQPYSA